MATYRGPVLVVLGLRVADLVELRLKIIKVVQIHRSHKFAKKGYLSKTSRKVTHRGCKHASAEPDRITLHLVRYDLDVDRLRLKKMHENIMNESAEINILVIFFLSP